MSVKRVFLIVADSFGIGEAPDSYAFGDEGADTLASCFGTGMLELPCLGAMGLYNIDGVNIGEKADMPTAAYMRCAEASAGKDTTIGHWEIAGHISRVPFPTFPDGFPDEVIELFSKITGRGVLCNRPYSGTQVIMDYGEEHIRSGSLIVYTSADSVFQIAAHTSVVSIDELYEYCGAARKILCGKYSVARVIARPFEGSYPDFRRVDGRRDFSVEPPGKTMTDVISENGLVVYGIGKINDIFAGKGITRSVHTANNAQGMHEAYKALGEDFEGLCFVNLVDFDMLYGHQRDVIGYTAALNEFDIMLGEFCNAMNDDDVLVVCADHGCDPCFESTTDHTREYIPALFYGKSIEPGNKGTRTAFADIGKSICDLLGVPNKLAGKSII